MIILYILGILGIYISGIVLSMGLYWLWIKVRGSSEVTQDEAAMAAATGHY